MRKTSHQMTNSEEAAYYRQLYEEEVSKNQALQRINDEITSMIQEKDKFDKETEEQLKVRFRKEISHMRKMQSAELERQKEKELIFEKIKSALEDEIQLLKRQIRDKGSEIAYLEQTINYMDEEFLQKTTIKPNIKNDQNLKIQLAEREEKIQSLEQNLQEALRNISVFQLKENELQHHLELKNKEQQTIKIQLAYYKGENAELMSQIANLKKRITILQNQKNEQFQFQAQKWLKVQQNLLSRIETLEKSGSSSQAREEKLYRQIKIKNEQLEKQKGKLKDQQSQLNWYKALLEEAKSQFISVELEQDEKTEKLRSQKQELLKETQRLRKEMGKSDSRCLLNSRKTGYYGNKTNSKSIICFLEKTPQKSFMTSGKERKSIRGTTKKN